MGSAEQFLAYWIEIRSDKEPSTSAAFIVFTIVITDFGNPMVIGGDYNVLATEMYNQVSGQANFELGAVIGMLLLVPAALAVAAEKSIARRQPTVVTAQSVPLAVRPDRWRDRYRRYVESVRRNGGARAHRRQAAEDGDGPGRGLRADRSRLRAR